MNCNTTGSTGCGGCAHEAEHSELTVGLTHLDTILTLGYIDTKNHTRLKNKLLRRHLGKGAVVVDLQGLPLTREELLHRELFSRPTDTARKVKNALANGFKLRLVSSRPAFKTFPPQGIQLEVFK